MKGIILAGGVGSRLKPVTNLLNKNLLPIYNKPGIFYSIEMFQKAGIEEICIVAEHNYIDDFTHLIGNGTDFNVKISYENDTPIKKGPASAIYYAKDFVGGDNVAVVFADGNYDVCIKNEVEAFEDGALVFLKEVHDPERFGVFELDPDNNVLSIEEKPAEPKSNTVFTGMAIYDHNLFDYIEQIEPGKDGEYYTVDVDKIYLNDKKLRAIPLDGFWQDIGTFDGMLRASNYWYEKINGVRSCL